MGGRRRRHGGGARPPRRARRTGRHVPRRTADQDARRGRRHVLGLRATVGGGRRRHRAARRDHPRAVGVAGADAYPRGTAHRRGRAARRRLLRSGGQPRRPPAVAGRGWPDPVLGCDRRARHRLTARRRCARRSGDAPAAQPRAPGARFRAPAGDRRRRSRDAHKRCAYGAARPARGAGRPRAVRRARPRARATVFRRGRPRSPVACARC